MPTSRRTARRFHLLGGIAGAPAWMVFAGDSIRRATGTRTARG